MTSLNSRGLEMFLLVTFALTASAQERATQMMTGGWRKIDVNGEQVLSVTNFALEAIKRTNNRQNPDLELSLLKIQEARVQVVNGLNYRSKFTIQIKTICNNATEAPRAAGSCETHTTLCVGIVHVPRERSAPYQILHDHFSCEENLASGFKNVVFADDLSSKVSNICNSRIANACVTWFILAMILIRNFT